MRGWESRSGSSLEAGAVVQGNDDVGLDEGGGSGGRGK